MWSPADILDAIAAGFEVRARELDAEHAVYGLDALDEVQLHPVVASSLRAADFGVMQEQRYPADRHRRRISEGERCDFVLTPARRPLRQPEQAGTLFDPPDAVDLDGAFWMEMKVAAQFLPEGPNRQYASQLLSTVRRDVTKLSKDAGILHAGLLIILFVQSKAIASHDLQIWQDRCLARSLPIASPAIRDLQLNDRLGNAHCTLALYPVRHM